MNTLALWYDSQPPAPVADLLVDAVIGPEGITRGSSFESLRTRARELVPWVNAVKAEPEPLSDGVKPTCDDASNCPSVELHFNLWRDLDGGVNFLDVGFRLSKVQNLRAFYLYVPAPLERSQVLDLGHVLKLGKTLNAVFNSVIKLDHQGDDLFTTVENDRPHLTVHLLREQDLIVEALGSTGAISGSQIIFTERLCTRIREKCEVDSERDAYLRIRIELDGPSKDLFTEEVQLGELFLDNALTRQELTEFRLNEKRSYPERIAELADGQSFRISAVHYFLIRDFRHQLANQHEPSRKVRRLESEMWKNYLAAGSQPEDVEPAGRVTKRMLIYHWRKIAGSDAENLGQGVDSFLAFASFREVVPNRTLYFAVVLLGALGSLIASAAASLVGALLVWISLYCWPLAQGEKVSERFATLPLVTGFTTLFAFAAFLFAVIWRRNGGRLRRKNLLAPKKTRTAK